MVHPRVSVSGLCFPELSAADAIEAIAGLGVANTSITGANARGTWMADRLVASLDLFTESRWMFASNAR